MEKLCWWIDEKREEMASLGTISKNLDLNSNLVM
jgi:hypothetical protein